MALTFDYVYSIPLADYHRLDISIDDNTLYVILKAEILREDYGEYIEVRRTLKRTLFRWEIILGKLLSHRLTEKSHAKFVAEVNEALNELGIDDEVFIKEEMK